jgi:NAD(P)-dependent dehydrogenase (short-subunit alcohol dehydrogenase family)
MRPTRTWIVTGGNAGLGFQCCRFLAQQPGSLIVIACRDARKGEAAAQGLRREGGAAEVLPLDLNALGAVRAFVEAFRRADLPPLAGIICNAGIQIITAPTQTADGFETTFGVNHLAHYLLVRLLLDDLDAGGNIVFVSSNTHDPEQKTGLPEPRFDGAWAVAHDLESGADAGRRRYTTSKLCNIYGTYELARQLDQSGDPRLQSIHVNAFDPGMMPGTGLARTYPAPLRFVWNYVLPALTLFQKNVNRPSTSGRRLAALASGQMGELKGKYVSMGEVFPSSPLSHDASKAWDLWKVSAEMTGLPGRLNVAQMPSPACN